MSEEEKRREPFSKWIIQPQTLIALSALLLSLCGLFISLYEASLIRQAQRASTWPNIEVGFSLRDGNLNLWVRNTGVGPARIQAGAVIYEGKAQQNWRDLMNNVLGEKADSVGIYYSLINGSVLASNSERETIFSLIEGTRGVDQEVIKLFHRALLDGAIDVTVCYGSVYDEYWTTNLQNMQAQVKGTREMKNCNSAPYSGI